MEIVDTLTSGSISLTNANHSLFSVLVDKWTGDVDTRDEGGV